MVSGCCYRTPQFTNISFFVRANNNGTNWYYLEEAEIRKTKEQIIARNLTVQYQCYAVIRCGISQELTDKIDNKFKLATSQLWDAN